MLSRPARDERGMVIVFMGLTMTVLLTIAAFAVDLGFDRQVTRHEQSGTDAGALAGALELSATATADATKAATARSTAAEYAVESLVDGAAPVLPSPTCSGNTCTYVIDDLTLTVTTPYTPVTGVPSRYSSSNFIHVRVCQPGGSFFRSILGSGPETLCRDAVARHRDLYSGYARGLISLNQSQCASIEFDGSSSTNLHSDGAIVVESSCSPNALDGGGAAWEVEAGLITVVGDYQINPCTEEDCFNGTVPISGVLPQGDPLGGLAEPERPSTIDPARNAGGVNPIAGGPACTWTYQPGTYTSPLNVNNNEVACFAPGLYYMEGGFNSNGNAQLFGTGVFFFIHSGALQMNGTGRMELEPIPTTITETDPVYGTLFPWRGITFFQDHDNTAGARINGNDASSIGTVYLPSAHLDFQGNASGVGDDFVTGQVIADTIRISGNGYLSIDADEPPQADDPEEDIGLEN